MKDLPYITIGRFSVLFIILLLSTTTIAQNREMKEYNVDSTLYVYYQQCKANIQSPIVLPMSDTLFTMAQTKSDPRMQAVALSTKLDYYYFKGQEDSIIAWVERVKKFAQETEQSKYYYFAWGKRLILFYIKNGKFNTALYEAQNMLREAQQEDNKEGIAYCYDCIGDIYILKRLRQQAIDAKLKAIEIIETYHLNAYNLHSKYMSVAKLYNDMLQPQKANDIIKKAEKLVHNNNQAFEQKLQYVAYYLRVNQLEKAQKALEEAEELFKHDKTLINRQKNLIVSRESYYKQTKQYQKALQDLEEQEKLAAEMGETQLGLEVKMRKGQIYYWMRQKDLAADYLYDYINLADSINNINEQAAITEFSSLLNFEKIKIEKKELELKAKEAELKHNRSFILLLVSTLFIVFILFYREFYLNKKLKHSKKLLLIKNQELTESENNLRKARDKAEKASNMKTSFIRNMTHEIRTPLNSIVGFSQVISSQFKKDDETHEFANLIEKNSDKLLKLIDDVLELSDLESSEDMELESTNIHICCEQALSKIQPYISKDVSLEFHPGNSELFIHTNKEAVSKILFNLLHNAAKFTEKGKITLAYSLSEAKDQISISVTDTGIGIPADKQEIIFERFTKVSNFSQGCGLGLALSKLLAQKLGGNLVIDKTNKTGSRFVLTLPVQ